ncbi:MAG: spore cortex biosynthesis protein YabQ [Alkaliphilus sp.]
MYSINQEALMFMTTIYGGILIGFIYEMYKVFRKIFNPKAVITSIQDMFLLAMITMVTFYILIISNQADLRYYSFMGFFIGVIIYRYILATSLSDVLLGIVRILSNYVLDVLKICIFPYLMLKGIFKICFFRCKKNTSVLYCKLTKQKGIVPCQRKKRRKKAKFLL